MTRYKKPFHSSNKLSIEGRFSKANRPKAVRSNQTYIRRKKSQIAEL